MGVEVAAVVAEAVVHPSGRNAGRGHGRGLGYLLKPQATKTVLCKDLELEGHIFDYGVGNVADLLRTTQEKIA